MDFLCKCSSCGEKCDISCKKDDVGFCPFCSAKLEHKKRHLPISLWFSILALMFGLLSLGATIYVNHEVEHNYKIIKTIESSGSTNNSGI